MGVQIALRVAVSSVLIVCGAAGAHAKVVGIEVASRNDVVNGKSWGHVGPYERIIGKVYFTVDPGNTYNKIVPNIDKAPRNAQGAVEFSSDIYMLVPKDQSKGNGVALFEVPNRGNRDLATSLLGRFDHALRFDPAAPAEQEFGDGFLLNQGYTLVWVGWQFSVPHNGKQIATDLPIATENGQPVTGRVNAPFLINMSAPTVLLDPDTSRYPPVDLNSPDDTLSDSINVYDIPRAIPRDRWQFAKLVSGEPVSDPASLYLYDGFQAGHTYHLSYTAKNTAVAGLGYAALRDVASYLKAPGGLVTSKYAYAFGGSQDGRVLREFIYEGFNADEQGQKAFDLVWSHLAGGGRGDFIQPFALPNGLGIFTSAMFPFSDVPQKDPFTGKVDGMEARMSRSVIPKIIYSNSDCEYWGIGRAASLISTTLDGKKDLKIPGNVRIYLFAGTQHEPGAFPPVPGNAQQKPNPTDYFWILRAVLVSADAWVRQGVAPPPSSYPRLSDGTLVAHESLTFPALPGVQSPSIIPAAYRVDLGGPQSAPKVPFLVPQVDADGNDIGGIRMPEVAVPLATYTGWNFRNPAIGAPTEVLALTGSFLPFAATRAEREQNHDPRPSIQERYSNRDDYLGRVSNAAQKLVRERYLLSQDVDPIVQRAGVVWDTVVGATVLKSAK